MSIHKSLVPISRLRRHRNVLKRDERMLALSEEGRWTDGGSVFGLPKVRSIMARAKAKVKKEAAAGEAGAVPAAGAAAAAAPAAGAKGAAAPAAKGAAAAAAKGAAAPAAKAAAPAAKKADKK
ncbi:MAG: small basic protein [Planctomycetes bacterium]|nr:small basic protein [Planctomycetota bacterium]